MKQEYVNNMKMYAETIHENTMNVLSNLSNMLYLVTGKQTGFDMMYNGNVVVWYDEERMCCFSFFEAIDYFKTKLEETL